MRRLSPWGVDPCALPAHPWPGLASPRERHVSSKSLLCAMGRYQKHARASLCLKKLESGLGVQKHSC